MRGEDILAHGRKEKRRSEKELRREEKEKKGILVLCTQGKKKKKRICYEMRDFGLFIRAFYLCFYR